MERSPLMDADRFAQHETAYLPHVAAMVPRPDYDRTQLLAHAIRLPARAGHTRETKHEIGSFRNDEPGDGCRARYRAGDRRPFCRQRIDRLLHRYRWPGGRGRRGPVSQLSRRSPQRDGWRCGARPGRPHPARMRPAGYRRQQRGRQHAQGSRHDRSVLPRRVGPCAQRRSQRRVRSQPGGALRS